MEYIPGDLVTQILSRLSVKDLVRFRKVCKSWCSLITSPSFVTAHVEFHKENPFILAKFKDRISGDYMISILSRETLEVVDTDHDLPHNVRIHEFEAGDMEIVSSCNGVVCLRYGHSTNVIVLWNPATRDTKLVPTSELYPARRSCINSGIGFGFDAKNNDYKVVRVHEFFGIEVEVEVYSLRTDSWRLVNDSSFQFYRHCFGSSAYLHGMYSWLAFKTRVGRPQENVLLSFNMNDETVVSTPLPSTSNINSSLAMNCLMVLDRSLAVVDDICCIWVLDGNQYGAKGSWTRLFSVPSLCVERPLGYWRDGMLFVETESKNQSLLDVVTQERGSAPILKRRRMLQVSSFTESLVPVSRNCM